MIQNSTFIPLSGQSWIDQRSTAEILELWEENGKSGPVSLSVVAKAIKRELIENFNQDALSFNLFKAESLRIGQLAAVYRTEDQIKQKVPAYVASIRRGSDVSIDVVVEGEQVLVPGFGITVQTECSADDRLGKSDFYRKCINELCADLVALENRAVISLLNTVGKSHPRYERGPRGKRPLNISDIHNRITNNEKARDIRRIGAIVCYEGDLRAVEPFLEWEHFCDARLYVISDPLLAGTVHLTVEGVNGERPLGNVLDKAPPIVTPSIAPEEHILAVAEVSMALMDYRYLYSVAI